MSRGAKNDDKTKNIHITVVVFGWSSSKQIKSSWQLPKTTTAQSCCWTPNVGHALYTRNTFYMHNSQSHKTSAVLSYGNCVTFGIDKLDDRIVSDRHDADDNNHWCLNRPACSHNNTPLFLTLWTCWSLWVSFPNQPPPPHISLLSLTCSQNPCSACYPRMVNMMKADKKEHNILVINYTQRFNANRVCLLLRLLYCVLPILFRKASRSVSTALTDFGPFLILFRRDTHIHKIKQQHHRGIWAYWACISEGSVSVSNCGQSEKLRKTNGLLCAFCQRPSHPTRQCDSHATRKIKRSMKNNMNTQHAPPRMVKWHIKVRKIISINDTSLNRFNLYHNKCMLAI